MSPEMMKVLGWVGVAIGWLVVIGLAWKQATEADVRIQEFRRRYLRGNPSTRSQDRVQMISKNRRGA